MMYRKALSGTLKVCFADCFACYARKEIVN